MLEAKEMYLLSMPPDLRGGRRRRSSAGAVSYSQHFTDALWELGLKEGDVREKVASSKDSYDALALQLDTRLLDLHERVQYSLRRLTA